MITEATTLGELDRALQFHGLVAVHITTVIPSGQLCAHVFAETRSVGAYGYGNTPAEAIEAALAEWALNTNTAREP